MTRQQLFAERGYELLSQLLSPAQVAHYAKLARRLAIDPQLARHQPNPGQLQFLDGVTMRPEFWSLIVQPGLLDAVRELIGSAEIMYVRHTDIHVQHPRLPGWHRDITRPIDDIFAAIEADPATPYRIVRALFYLEDTEFTILDHSHERSGIHLGLRAANIAMKVARRLGDFDVIAPGPATTIKIKKGDCLIINVLALHTGNAVDDEHPKVGVFLAFGAMNRHSILHSVLYGRHSGRPIPDDLKSYLAARQIGYCA